MRWLTWLVVFASFSARAASVLLVPQDDKARVAAEAMVETFTAEKLVAKMAPAGSPAVTCLATPATRDECLAIIEGKAKVVGVFIVGGGLKGAKGVVTLELFANGKSVKKDTIKVTKARLKKDLKGPTLALLKLAPKDEDATPTAAPAKVTVTETPKPEATPEPVVVADAPKQETPQLTPQPKPEPVVDLKQPTPPAAKPKVAAWVVTGLAVAAAGTAATFGTMGMLGKSRLETAPDGVSPLSYNEALALQQQSNTQLTVALGTGIGAGASAVVAAILWGVE